MDARRKDSFQVWKVPHPQADIPEGSLEEELLWGWPCRGGWSLDRSPRALRGTRCQGERLHLPLRETGAEGLPGSPEHSWLVTLTLPSRSPGHRWVLAGRDTDSGPGWAARRWTQVLRVLLEQETELDLGGGRSFLQPKGLTPQAPASESRPSGDSRDGEGEHRGMGSESSGGVKHEVFTHVCSHTA